MKKEIEFRAKMDFSDFDKSIADIQRKLKDVMAPANMAQMQQATGGRLAQNGMGGVMSAPSMEAFTRATQQSRREMDQLILSQAQGQEKLGRIIAQRSEMLKKLQNQQKEMTKDAADELAIKEKISRVEANNQQLRETYRQRDAALNQAMDARESLGSGGGGGRFGRAFSSIGAGGVGAGIGIAGAGLMAGSDIYRSISRAPIRTEQSMGSAVQGVLGGQAANIYGRHTAFEQMWTPERARAAQMSMEALDAAKTADTMKFGGSLLKAGGMGLAGMATGAGIGSVVPGIGTAIGGAVGGIGGLYKGLSGMDERSSTIGMGLFSPTQNKRYQSMLAEEVSKDYEATLEAQKRQNPFKQLATNEYEQNFQRNLGAQRSMGLGNTGFYGPGGFMQSNIGAGFTPEMGLEMSSSIMGAGGSTRMGRNSVFGNQLARGADLTNAGQVLGTLSGGLGGSKATEQATIKILAEGMKLGLDDSKFAEENRRFTQMTAEIIAKSGATGEGDFGQIAGGFGKFVGENTNAGMTAAKTAYEQYQEISQTTTGPRGVMRAAGFLSDPNLSKLSTISKQALMQVPESDLNEDNPLVQNAATEAGVSAADIVKSVTGTNQGAVSRFRQSDQLRDKLRGYAKSIGKENLSVEDIQNAPENVRNDFNQMTAFQTTELGYLGQKGTMSRGLGTINPGGAATGDMENAQRNKIYNTETGRMEDTTVRAMAADSKSVLDNFNDMAPAMKKAAESAAAWTREVREMNAALMSALESSRTGKDARSLQTLQDILNQMARPGNQTQVQAGKQSK